jgi:hypothetical protein
LSIFQLHLPCGSSKRFIAYFLGSIKNCSILVFLAALLIRIGLYYHYMASKPLFGDEVAYVKAGELYIQHFLQGHRGLDECLQCNYEHPMFAKMLIGSSIFIRPISGGNSRRKTCGAFKRSFNMRVTLLLAEKCMILRLASSPV